MYVCMYVCMYALTTGTLWGYLNVHYYTVVFFYVVGLTPQCKVSGLCRTGHSGVIWSEIKNNPTQKCTLYVLNLYVSELYVGVSFFMGTNL